MVNAGTTSDLAKIELASTDQLSISILAIFSLMP